MGTTFYDQRISNVLSSIIKSADPEEIVIIGDNSLETTIVNINSKIRIIHIKQTVIPEFNLCSANCIIIFCNLFDYQSIQSFIDKITINNFELLIIEEITNELINVDNFLKAIIKLIGSGYVNQLDVPIIVDDYYIGHFKHRNQIDQATQYEQALLSLSEKIIRQRQLLIQLRKDDSKLMELLNTQQEKIEQQQIERKDILRQRDYAEEQWLFWKNRWTAFETSRSWQFLMFLQRLKKSLTLPVRAFNKMKSLWQLSLIVIRTQGFRRFLSLTKRHLKRFTHLEAKKPIQPSHETIKQIYDIDGISSLPPISEKTEVVDIIICVHNALEDVKQCLHSILSYTTQPFHIILVDDGSEKETELYLEEFHAEHQSYVTLLRSEKATGYTVAANRGLRTSTAPYIVLLNSDTIVTSHWLDRMIACMNHQARIGIVGPLSNTASWQSVPLIEENSDWARNELPNNLTIEEMSQIIAESSSRIYPNMPFLNGFCLLINREVINDIGYLDENNFGPGYGEEDDFIIRARKANWKTILADDTYVYHSQSRSYSSERRKTLSKSAGKRLRFLHGDEIIDQGVQYCSHDRVLEGIRARAAAGIQQRICVIEGSKFSGKKILYILPINSPGGGANVVISESLAMIKMGVQVEFYNLEMNRDEFKSAYPDLPINVIYGNISDLKNIIPRYDAVIATYNPSVGWIKKSLQPSDKPIIGYYIQDFEPLMYPEDSFEYRQAFNSYSLISNMVRFTKTQWTRQTVFEHTGMDSKLIGISINTSLFRPRPQKFNRIDNFPIRIMAMIRPESKYRQPYETMQLLKLAANKYGNKIDICIFGTSYDNPGFSELPNDFPFRLFGVLSQQKVASLLNEADIFIDFSSHQAMGLTALEAMACGAAVIVPQNGGAIEFANHELNGLVYQNNNVNEVWGHLQRLIEDEHLRQKIQHTAIYDACKYFPEKASTNILKTLFGDKVD